MDQKPSKLISIKEYGQCLSRRLSTSVGLALFTAGVPFVVLFTVVLQTWSINRVVHSVETQLANSIKIGDEFQLVRTANSLITDGLFEAVDVLDEQKKLIFSNLQNDKDRFNPFAYSLVYPVAASGQTVAHLVVHTRFPFLILVAFLTTLIIFTLTLRWYARRILIKVSTEVSQPLVDFPLVLQGTMSQSSLKLLELDTLYRNVLELRNKEMELDRANAEKNRNEALAQLAAQVAHDIRSPLSALKSLSVDMTASPQEHSDLINKVVNRITGIADDLLRQNRKSSEDDTSSCIDLKELVGDLLEEKRAQLSEGKKVEFKSDFDHSQTYSVKIERVEVQRILSNLLNNSEESIEKDGQVTVGLRSSKRDISLVVMDSGKGIPTAILEQVGKRGFSHGKSGKGNGLGLSYAVERLRHYGGDLTIQSREGVGTIITAVFPRMDAKSS